ncbi:MAG: LptF/LptG family permease [Gemmatimonadota bacterium]|jgi:lipopolysaccharide export system permease protein
MKILDRYITSQFLKLFGLFAMASPVLFVLGDVTENLDRYINRGVSPAMVALGYIYGLPLYILWSVPIAALIATIFTVNNMTRHSEVAAAKAGGISFFRLYAALPVLGVLLTFLALGLTELAPITNRLRAQAQGEKTLVRSDRTDFVYRDTRGRAYSIRRLDVDRGYISGLSVERQGNEPVVPGVNIIADGASYKDGHWILQDGFVRLFNGRDVERTFKFAADRLAGFTETPQQLLAQPKEPDEMTYGELSQLIDILRRSGGKPLDLMVERDQKIALPVATLIIILFAAPLATSSRRGGAAYGVGISLAVTIVYIMSFKVAGAAGNAGSIPPDVAAWSPNVIFAAAAGVLTAKVRT